MNERPTMDDAFKQALELTEQAVKDQVVTSGTPSKRVFFERVVAELNLDTRDAFTLLFANACALADQRDALQRELAAAQRDVERLRDALVTVANVASGEGQRVALEALRAHDAAMSKP